MKLLHCNPQCAAILFTLLVCTAWPGGFGKRGLMPSWDHLGSFLVRLLPLSFVPFIPLEVQDLPCSCLLTFILCAAPFDLENCFGFCWFVPALHPPLTQQAHSCLLKLPGVPGVGLGSQPAVSLCVCHHVTHSWAFLGGLLARVILYWCHKLVPAKPGPGTRVSTGLYWSSALSCCLLPVHGPGCLA